MKSTKKEPIPEMIGMPMMGGVNFPPIEVPKFDGIIMKWRPFWEQFQAAIQNKPHLEDVDKLTYLRDAIKGGRAMYVIQGGTQTAESYGEAIKYLEDSYECLELPIMSISGASFKPSS